MNWTTIKVNDILNLERRKGVKKWRLKLQELQERLNQVILW